MLKGAWLLKEKKNLQPATVSRFTVEVVFHFATVDYQPNSLSGPAVAFVRTEHAEPSIQGSDNDCKHSAVYCTWGLTV